MKPTPIFVAAAGFAMLGACSVTSTDDDNASQNADSDSAVTAEGNVESAPQATGETDTLGNQLNQLNDSAAAANEAENSKAGDSVE